MILTADLFTEAMGYAASALVLATFCFGNPVSLRLCALLSNAAFIVFGYFAGIDSIMLLHMILVPINGLHLARLLKPQLSASLAPFCFHARRRLTV